MTRLIAIVPSITAGTTPTLHPMIDANSRPAVMFHFIPERWTLPSVAIAVTAKTGRLLAYERICPSTCAQPGFA
jgi:hypothetical protein